MFHKYFKKVRLWLNADSGENITFLLNLNIVDNSMKYYV